MILVILRDPETNKTCFKLRLHHIDILLECGDVYLIYLNFITYKSYRTLSALRYHWEKQMQPQVPVYWHGINTESQLIVSSSTVMKVLSGIRETGQIYFRRPTCYLRNSLRNIRKSLKDVDSASVSQSVFFFLLRDQYSSRPPQEKI